MLRSSLAILIVLATLSACASYAPREKVAVYDPVTKELTMPYPCPDWSQAQTLNYKNERDSNYGCAVNTNSALQVADPRDLYEGHGDSTPDTGITSHVIELYRAGTIPVPLVPQDAAASSTAQ